MVEHLAKSPETILVVDDVDIVLNLVVEVLQSAGFNVLQAQRSRGVKGCRRL